MAGSALNDEQLEVDIVTCKDRLCKSPYILSCFGRASASASHGRRSGQKMCTLGGNMSGLCRLVALMYVVPGDSVYFMPS